MRTEEQKREYGRQWSAKNKTHLREVQKAWRHRNRERLRPTWRKAAAKWRAKDPEAAIAYQRNNVRLRKYGITPEQFDHLFRHKVARVRYVRQRQMAKSIIGALTIATLREGFAVSSVLTAI